jgi:hypothetical protein
VVDLVVETGWLPASDRNDRKKVGEAISRMLRKSAKKR